MCTVGMGKCFLPSETILRHKTNFQVLPVIKCTHKIFEYPEQTTAPIIKYSENFVK